MRDAMTIDKLEQIKALVHPLRMRLLEVFSHKPMTTKQAAEVMNEPPTKLYHHVDALEKAGLIRLKRTSKKRGTLEKYYEIAAQAFTVDRKLFQLTPRAGAAFNEMQAAFTGILEQTLLEVRRNIKERIRQPRVKNRVTMVHTKIRVTPDQIKALNREIDKLIKKYDSLRSKKDAVDYGCTLVFYPVKNNKKTKIAHKKRSKK
jgi:DNA-binding transcriptional ArsR family regulator